MKRCRWSINVTVVVVVGEGWGHSYVFGVGNVVAKRVALTKPQGFAVIAVIAVIAVVVHRTIVVHSQGVLGH